jgi:hypothetical protein
MSALPLRPDIHLAGRDVRFMPILLQKSFRDGGRKFLDPLMRFTCGDVRDHLPRRALSTNEASTGPNTLVSDVTG